MTIEQEARLRNRLTKAFRFTVFLAAGLGVLKLIQLSLIFIYLQGYYYGCHDIQRITGNAILFPGIDPDALEKKCREATMKQWESK